MPPFTENSPHDYEPSFPLSFLVAGTSASLVRSVTLPYDILMLRELNYVYKFYNNLKTMGILERIRMICKIHEIKSLWKLYFESVKVHSPKQALNFACFETKRTNSQSNKVAKKKRFILNFLSGAVAGAISGALIYPFEIFRWLQKNDHRKGEYSSMLDSLKHNFKSESTRSLSRVLVPGVCFNLIYRCFYFGAYKNAVELNNMNGSNLFKNFALACLTSTVAITVSFPLDTIYRGMLNGHNRRTKSLFEFTYELWRAMGVRTFFRGNSYICCIRAPRVGAVLALYDRLEYFIKRLGNE